LSKNRSSSREKQRLEKTVKSCSTIRIITRVTFPPTTKEASLFGQRLAADRRSKGLSQCELAERLGVTREMVDYYERRAPGPVSQLERRIEQVKLLPRKKQQLIIEFLDAIISTEKA